MNLGGGGGSHLGGFWPGRVMPGPSIGSGAHHGELARRQPIRAASGRRVEPGVTLTASRGACEARDVSEGFNPEKPARTTEFPARTTEFTGREKAGAGAPGAAYDRAAARSAMIFLSVNSVTCRAALDSWISDATRMRTDAMALVVPSACYPALVGPWTAATIGGFVANRGASRANIDKAEAGP